MFFLPQKEDDPVFLYSKEAEEKSLCVCPNLAQSPHSTFVFRGSDFLITLFVWAR